MHVSLDGEIDLLGVRDARAKLDAAVNERPGEMVVVDVSGVTFVDSSAVGMLVSVHRRAVERGGGLLLVDPRPAFRHLLEITGLSKILLGPVGSP